MNMVKDGGTLMTHSEDFNVRFVYPSVHLYILLPICLSFCPYVYPSVHLSILLSICDNICEVLSIFYIELYESGQDTPYIYIFGLCIEKYSHILSTEVLSCFLGFLQQYNTFIYKILSNKMYFYNSILMIKS